MTDLLTVGELLCDPSTTYVVPIYQRNYAWGTEQIEQLISDIEDARRGGQDGDSSYFIGNLVVTSRGDGVYEVIDGQQRLTTILVLLLALRAHGGLESAVGTPLRYESRPRSSMTLDRLGRSKTTKELGDEPDEAEDHAICSAMNAVLQFLQVDDNVPGGLDALASYLVDRVVVVRAQVPRSTDLNRYFEIMNTRGAQLQQVDIVKARLMGALDDDLSRSAFARIWDACSDMDNYVQMSLTRNDVTLRDRVFGSDWSQLAAADFDGLESLLASEDGGGESSGAREPVGSSLDEVILRYSGATPEAQSTDPDSDRFRSILDFPVFLLHVLQVWSGPEGPGDVSLDDKHLIDRFESTFADVTEANAVKEFGHHLLRMRVLFDGYVLKRQYTTRNSDDGDWSMLRLERSRSSGRKSQYVSTFGGRATEDGAVAEEVSDILLLQSMLRVTYTSPRTMHWVTEVLRGLSDGSITGEAEMSAALRTHARQRVRAAFFDQGQPEGFNIQRIVFTYLDYLLLDTAERREKFRFTFRNSIEHFYPQSIDVEQSGSAVSADRINRLGNLALVTVSANSKFSNSLPAVKAEAYAKTIELQSPKLELMAERARSGRSWDDSAVDAHHEEMVTLLREDVMMTP